MSTGLFDPAAFGAAEDAVVFIGNVLESSTEYSIIATDPQGEIVLWNEGARRLYGYPPAEIVGQSWAVLLTEEDVRAGLAQKMADEALRRDKWEGTVERVRKDGSRFTAHVVTTPRWRANGEPAGFLLISTDITERVQLSGDLAYARSLVESAPDAMVIVNPEGEIQLANAETERMFGYSRDALVGEAVEILIPERYRDRHPAHRDGFFHAPRLRPMGAGLELSGLRQDGSEFAVEISLSPLETAQGQLATAAIRDVTERKRVEQELRDANVQLEAASRAKDRFLASMSHELRTPLNAVLGFTGTLLMELPGPLNEEQTKQLSIVQTSGRHLLSLINDLLDLARIESGKFEIEVETIDCQEILEEVALGLRPLAEAKGIEFDVGAPEEPLTIETDRRALSQILINLANNAIKFTDEGGIQLTATRRSNDAGSVTRFSVIDTGSGIQPGDQETLFAAFERVGTPGSRPYEGTGLGLYICQTLSTLIGGSITFKSEFGKGSTFTLDVRE